MPRIKKILCPVDFSPASDHAVRYAAEFAKTDRAAIRLFHVIAPVIPSAYEYSVNVADLMKTLEEASERQMSRLVQSVKKTGVKVEGEVSTGDVLGQINAAIDAYDPDLIVIGAHSKGILDRILVGSTAERVVRHASRPVLVIPPEAPAKKSSRTTRK